MLRVGYCTNGLAHHRLADAVDLLADLGYAGIAITPDVGELDLDRLVPERVGALRRKIEDRGLAVVVETGARYALDPRRKHHPNLLDPTAAGRARRVDAYQRAIDLAWLVGAPVVSLWSGAAEDGARAETGGATNERAWARLVEGLAAVLEHARAAGVRIAFEPEPGMFVERPAGYLELVRRLGEWGNELHLTLDLGHLVVTGDVPAAEQVRALAQHLAHVQLDDARAGVHEHLALGAGELDLAASLKALLEVGYDGMAAVELSRDSHRGPEAAREALATLSDLLPPGAFLATRLKGT